MSVTFDSSHKPSISNIPQAKKQQESTGAETENKESAWVTHDSTRNLKVLSGTNSPTVTSAELNDAEEIVALVNTAYQRDYFRCGDALPRTTLEKVKGYFANPDFTWFVIKGDEKKKILCTALYSSDKASESLKEGNVHMLSAHPSVWGKKFSKLLLDQIEKQAKEDKQSKIRLLVVNTSPKLIEYYKQNGFSLTDEEFQIPEDRIRSECRGKDSSGKAKVFALFMEKKLASLP